MAAVLSPHSDGVRAALVYQAVALTEALKVALSGAGVQIVVEVRADALDRTALNTADPQVFVVNLDPDLEDHLDELTEVLDGFSRPVIFNDASASNGLSGWDQARWARHLGAKIKGEVDAHPPRPEGSTFIPPVERKLVQIAAPRVAPVESTSVPAASAAAAPAAAPIAAAPAMPATSAPSPPPVVTQPTADRAPPVVSTVTAPAAPQAAAGGIDVDALFADLLPQAEPAPPPVRSAQSPTVELPIVAPRESARAPANDTPEPEVDEFGFDLSVSELDVVAEVGSVQENSDAGSADLSDLWNDSALDASVETATGGFGQFDSFDTGFDAPLEGESLADFELPEPARAVDAELTDLDELFRELEPQDTKAAAPAAPTPKVAEPVRKPAELKPPPSDWSLEPLDGEGLADEPVPTGRAQFEIGKEVSVPIPPVAAPVVPQPVAPIEQADNELAAFDFFFEPNNANASTSPPASDITSVGEKARAPINLTDIPDFGLSLEPLEEPQPIAPAAVVPPVTSTAKASQPTAAPAPASRAPAAAPAEELGAFDFNFDNFDEPTPPSKSSQRNLEAAALADLDGLFADIEAPPVVSDVPNLDRIWILGASIGGPEAVRSFLAGLKKQVASAFILAQHMGSEFLDLMIGQLAKASPLPVKVAQAGDKLQNGTVLVAPIGKRLTVDAQGRVQLGEMSSDMPYSPSIDQIMFDMADRFGPRCSAVIFSGMAADAIEGAKYIASKGGRIWVQDPATCVISSMIDGAQAAGVVSYVGSPEQLSEHLQAHLA